MSNDDAELLRAVETKRPAVFAPDTTVDQAYVAGQMDAQATEREKWKTGDGGTLRALSRRLFAQAYNEIGELRREHARLERLVADLQAHAREHGWQDVDEPIAALLAWRQQA